ARASGDRTMEGLEMKQLFEFAHLDPSCDPPERYRAAFDLFCEIWNRLRLFRSSHLADEFLVELLTHLENQLLAAGLILAVKIEATANTNFVNARGAIAGKNAVARKPGENDACLKWEPE